MCLNMDVRILGALPPPPTLVVEQADGNHGGIQKGFPQEVGAGGVQDEADDAQGVRSKRVHAEVFAAAHHLAFQTGTHAHTVP